jgi:hypothetical protein
MSNFSVVDGDIRLTTSGGGQLLHTDDQNRLKVVMDMVYVSHTLSGTDHTGQLSDDQVMSSNITQHESYIDHNNLTNYLVDEHRTINDGGAASTDLWSASKISSEIASSSGTTDHSALDNLDYASAGHTGFSPASHLHDDRYYTESEINTISGSLSNEIDSDISTHSSSADHDGRYYTESEVDALTWVESDITDLDKYTQSEVDDKWPTWSGTIDHNIILNTHNLSTDIDHNDLTNYSADEHRIINDVGDGATDLWSASKISSEINNASGTTNHSELNELDYTSSGHTGFQPAGDYVSTVDLSTTSGTLQSQINDKSDVNHLHDDRYYTESEVDTISGSLQTNIDDKPDTLIELTDTPSLYDTGKYLRSTSSGHTGFSPDTHLHDDRYYTETELNDGQLDNRYYTESEVDTISGSLSTETDSDISAHTSNTDAHHAESHTITSHSDIVDATGANIEELTGGGDTTLHDHDGISENTAARHTESHSVASHSDTSATGAELNTLTDNSIADTLHRHSELVASDGSPDPALSINDSGYVTVSGNLTAYDNLFSEGSGQIGVYGSGNRYAFFSLYGDDSTYGIRLVRSNTGVNAYSQVAHNGTGNFRITAEDASDLLLQTNNTTRMTIASTGNVSLTNGTGINEFSTDGTLAGDSDDAVPTEKATKTYAAGKSVDNVWSETQLYSDNSLTCASTTTWDMETYQNTYLLLDQDTTLSGTVPSSNSGYYTCLVYNDGTYTLTLDSQFLTSAGEDLENTTTSGSYDLLGVYINNGLLFATMSTNFS